MTSAWECPTCAADERYAPGTYCAPARCLCGHPECHAYPSWTPMRHLAAVPDVPVTRSTAWAEREDDTWIDRM